MPGAGEQIVLISKLVLRALAFGIVAISARAGAGVDDQPANLAIQAPEATHPSTAHPLAASLTSYIAVTPQSVSPWATRAGINAAPLVSVRSPTAADQRAGQSRSAGTDQGEQSAADLWLQGLVVTTLVAYQLRRKHRSLRTHSFGR